MKVVPRPIGRLLLAGLAVLICGEPAGGAPGRSVLQPASRTPFESDCGCGLGRKPSPFEPSGLVWDGADSLYAVSDSGQIVRRAVDAEGKVWSCLYVFCGDGKADPRAKAEHDFESVAFVPGAGFAGFLWIGVEGGEYSEKNAGPGDQKKRRLLPRILKFDLERKKFADVYWSLGGVGIGKGSGVEAMTFLPANTKTVPGGQNLGGLFLVSSQHGEGGDGEGRVHAYHLDAASRQDAESGESFISPVSEPFFLPDGGGASLRQASADFYYAPGGCALYVAYDDESDAVALDRDGRATASPGKQSVAVYAGSAPGQFVLAQEFSLPAGRGLEAVAAVGRPGGKIELFTAVDMSGGQNPGKFVVAANAGRVFAKKKDLKAAKGPMLPNTLDRYPGVDAAVSCPPG